jgi:hypothetical protein
MRVYSKFPGTDGPRSEATESGQGQVIIFTEIGLGLGRSDVTRRFFMRGHPALRDHRRESACFHRRRSRSVSGSMEPFGSIAQGAGRAERRGIGPSCLSCARIALGYLVSTVGFVVEEIAMRRFLRRVVVGSAVICLHPLAHTSGQTELETRTGTLQLRQPARRCRARQG